MEIYLSLGGNLGDRRRNIMAAVDRLDKAIGSEHVRMSALEESPAWGFSGPPFLDCIAVYDSDKFPQDADGARSLLTVCKRIEREMGRTDAPEYAPDGRRRYHDRTIDIDILLFGNLRMNTAELTVPHRLISDRPFIMKPLREVASSEIRTRFGDIFE